MSRAINAKDANQSFSRLLRDVVAGESFTVMSRGRAVARVVPADHTAESERLADLLTFVRGLPVRCSGAWTRDELYE